MTIKTTQTIGLDSKHLSPVTQTGTSSNWLRNPSWPSCEASIGDHKMVGLYAVWPRDGSGTGGNFFAITVAGAYTIDYGDGTVTNYATGVAAYHEFNYNSASLAGTDAPVTFTAALNMVTRTNHGYTDGMTVQFFNIVSTTGINEAQKYYVINSTANSFQLSNTIGGPVLTLTADGSATLLQYKIATVVITPQAGFNITSLNFYTKHNQAGLANTYSTGWLDFAIACSSLSSLTIGSGGTNVVHYYLELAKIVEMGSVTTFASLFRECKALRQASITADTSAVTNSSYMFFNCNSLTDVILFDTSSVTNSNRMFYNCYSLVEIPLFDISLSTDLSYMFYNCSSLMKIPPLNTVSATTTYSMFYGCYSLTTIPLLNTSSVTTMFGMFYNCASLLTIPLIDTSAATNTSNMFYSCGALTQLPALVMNGAATNTNMFYGCYSLSRVKTTGFSYTFSVANCQLSATALNELYTSLSTVTSQTITVSGNYGTAADDPTIATAKGWTVTG